MRTQITTYYLEMDPTELRPSRVDDAEVQVLEAKVPSPELNRFLYTAVGGIYHWVDRLSWSYDRWLEYLKRPEIETWIIYRAGNPAGYYELEIQKEAMVQIIYFGLLPQFVGYGLGGHLLTSAIERAQELNARRLWLHTCSLDHPNALAAYQARGLRVYKDETWYKDVAPTPPGPWPGA